MALADVGDLVGDDAGDLRLVFRGEHEAGVDADVAAQRRERVDVAFAEHEEGEVTARRATGGREAIAHVLQPLVDQRIVEHHAHAPQFVQHVGAVLALRRRVDHFRRGRAEVGQRRVLGGTHAGGGETESESDGGGEQAHVDGVSVEAGGQHSVATA